MNNAGDSRSRVLKPIRPDRGVDGSPRRDWLRAGRYYVAKNGDPALKNVGATLSV